MVSDRFGRPGKRRIFLALALLLVALALVCIGRRFWPALRRRVRGRSTVAQRVEQYGASARGRMAPWFEKAGVPYPPPRIVLLAVKDTRILKVYAPAADDRWRAVRSYPIHKASGRPGPKLREGDRQVPEGVYVIESLNPNSMFHLSLRLNYPNEFDRQRAQDDRRNGLGGDIFIHGGAASVGCLAMGDPAAEELFVLTTDVGRRNITVIITPVDFRARPTWQPPPQPPWVGRLYEQIRDAMAELP